MEFLLSDYELMQKLKDVGFDNLSSEEQQRADDLEAKAKQALVDDIGNERMQAVRDSIPEDKSQDYYAGLLGGFKKIAEMLTSSSPSRYTEGYAYPLSYVSMLSYFVAAYCIVLEDGFVEQEAKEKEINHDG